MCSYLEQQKEQYDTEPVLLNTERYLFSQNSFRFLFLGHMVSKHDISADLDKVAALKQVKVLWIFLYHVMVLKYTLLKIGCFQYTLLAMNL